MAQENVDLRPSLFGQELNSQKLISILSQPTSKPDPQTPQNRRNKPNRCLLVSTTWPVMHERPTAIHSHDDVECVVQVAILKHLRPLFSPLSS